MTITELLSPDTIWELIAIVGLSAAFGWLAGYVILGLLDAFDRADTSKFENSRLMYPIFKTWSWMRNGIHDLLFAPRRKVGHDHR